ncbi:MAG: rRNA maturation RNase YbeY [Treponema sp.]|jgi:probable rRNA maturation factor|nr:rRNA maturation RNase YbeY [Treponema sp.]
MKPKVDIIVDEGMETARHHWIESAESYILAVLDLLGKRDWEVSVLLCGDARIRALNARYRGIDAATDVLSFPQQGGAVGGAADGAAGAEGGAWPERGARRHAGDIVISLETLECGCTGAACAEEARRLLVHGILHLAGCDHEGPLCTEGPQTEPMLRRQEDILRTLMNTDLGRAL